MTSPPPVIAGLYVVAFAEADVSVTFEQRCTLNVDGQWMGRVPCLAICRDFDKCEFSVAHCSDEWDLLGIGGSYSSAEEAKVRIEGSYRGLGAKWTAAEKGLEEVHALYNEEMRAHACSFCGRTPLQVKTMVTNETARICGQCIEEHYAFIHAKDRSP